MAGVFRAFFRHCGLLDKYDIDVELHTLAGVFFPLSVPMAILGWAIIKLYDTSDKFFAWMFKK